MFVFYFTDQHDVAEDRAQGIKMAHFNYSSFIMLKLVNFTHVCIFNHDFHDKKKIKDNWSDI